MKLQGGVVVAPFSHNRGVADMRSSPQRVKWNRKAIGHFQLERVVSGVEQDSALERRSCMCGQPGDACAVFRLNGCGFFYLYPPTHPGLFR